ncbi:MAG: helix-turn-helix domain-containing protein [Actinomycetota bacterium]
MRRDSIGAKECSIARAIAVVGDPWALMFVREALAGETRFVGFQNSTGAQPSVVSDRLKRLLDAGIFERHEYSSHPPRQEYRLTKMGEDLFPVVMALNRWGDVHLSGDAGPPLVYRHETCGHDADPIVVCGHCGDPLTFGSVTVEPGPGATSNDPG